MSSSRQAMLLWLLGMLCALAGCARWSLRPAALTDSPHSLEAAQNPASLMPAAGLNMQAFQNATSDSANKRASQSKNDLQHLDPALAIARLTERQGDPGEARRQYRRYMEKHPQHPLPHHRLGVMAAREAKYDESEAHFQTAARLARPTAELLSDMGYLYYLQDRLDEAEALLRQANQLEPSDQSVNNNLALVLAAQGNFEHSLSQFRKVNEEPEARANLAYVLSQQGELEKARGEYLRALTLDNTLQNAARALVQVQEAGRREQAALASQEAAAGDRLREGYAQNSTQEASIPHALPAQLQRTSTPLPEKRGTVDTDAPQIVAASHSPALQIQPKRETSMLMPIPEPAAFAQFGSSEHAEPLPASSFTKFSGEVQLANFAEPVPAEKSNPPTAMRETADAFDLLGAEQTSKHGDGSTTHFGITDRDNSLTEDPPARGVSISIGG